MNAWIKNNYDISHFLLKINIPKVYGRNKGGKIQTTKYTEVMVLNKQWKYITMINFGTLCYTYFD